MKIIRVVFLVISLIIYIYGFGLVGFPVGPRTIMDIAGLAWLILEGKKYINVLSKKYMTLFAFTIVIATWGFITMLLNGSSEAQFLRYAKYFFPWVGGSYFIFRLSKGIIYDYKSLSTYIALAVGIESLIAVLIKVVPSVSVMAHQIFLFETGQYELDFESLIDYQRIIGLGDAIFFGVLPSCTIGVLSCIYLIEKETNKLSVTGYILLFILISITSYLTARTSGIVVILSLLLLAFFQLKNRNFLGGALRFGLVAFIGIFLLYIYIPDDFLSKDMIAFATDFNSNNTANHLKEWYTDVSFSPFTFMIGDAHYANPDGSYYGGMDIGYFRLIFYGGIIGLTLVVFYYYTFFRTLIGLVKEREIKLTFRAFFIAYLIMMLKGHIEFVDLLVLYLVFLDGFKKRNDHLQQMRTLHNNSNNLLDKNE